MLHRALVLILCCLPCWAWGQWCATMGSPLIRASDTHFQARGEVTVIPVVVHVVYRTPEQNISTAQIESQIDVLNKDFRALNTDLVGVPANFTSLIAAMEIEFELVDTDPSGNPHPGIIRKATQSSNLASVVIDGKRAIAYDDLGGSDAWCTDCYLNIWVGEFAGGLAGLGTFPGTVAPEEDGVFISFDRFGTLGTVTAPYDLGRTTVHEIGHYLNLLHTWGLEADPSLCLGDDFVMDTPLPDNDYLEECPSGIQLGCEGVDMYMNFMTFADDPCLLLFTKGQKQRAYTALEAFRPVLLGLETCDCIVSTNEAAVPLSLLASWWRVGEELFIEVNSPYKVDLSLFNLQGQLVAFQSEVIGISTLRVGHLAKGFYLLQLQSTFGQEVKKIIL